MLEDFIHQGAPGDDQFLVLPFRIAMKGDQVDKTMLVTGGFQFDLGDIPAVVDRHEQKERTGNKCSVTISLPTVFQTIFVLSFVSANISTPFY